MNFFYQFNHSCTSFWYWILWPRCVLKLSNVAGCTFLIVNIIKIVKIITKLLKKSKDLNHSKHAMKSIIFRAWKISFEIFEDFWKIFEIENFGKFLDFLKG